MNVIDIVADFYYNQRDANKPFTVKELRKYVNNHGKIVPNATITRALRQLRNEGSIYYTYENGIYQTDTGVDF